MSAWIKVRADLTSDPKVLKMARLLSDNKWTIVGRLADVWGWVGSHTTTGTGVELDESMIDDRVGLPGFAAAMRAVGWLEGADGALVFPRWDRHNSNSAKARALEAEAKRLRRGSDNAGTVTGQMPDGAAVALSDRLPTTAAGIVGPDKRIEEEEGNASGDELGGCRPPGPPAVWVPSRAEAVAQAESEGLSARWAGVWWDQQEPKGWEGLADWRRAMRGYVARCELTDAKAPKPKPAARRKGADERRPTSYPRVVDNRTDAEVAHDAALERLRDRLAPGPALEGPPLATVLMDLEAVRVRCNGSGLPGWLQEALAQHPEVGAEAG
jgi:hypothetical protein